jgi:hypothetical protein
MKTLRLTSTLLLTFICAIYAAHTEVDNQPMVLIKLPEMPIAKETKVLASLR